MHTMRKLEGKMTLKKVNWGGIVEIGGKVGRLLSGGVDTPVEDERRPLFKTSWSRSHCTVQPTLGVTGTGYREGRLDGRIVGAPACSSCPL